MGLGPGTGPLEEPRRIPIDHSIQFAIGSIDFEEIGFAIDIDRIYFTYRVLTGRVYLMRPIESGSRADI